MSEGTKAFKRSRVERLTLKWGWNRSHRRVWYLVSDHRPWWDWGHRLMTLVGCDDCGSWSEPKPPTWYYRRQSTSPAWRTSYPRHRFEVITDYKTFRAATEGLNEDQMYEWQAFYVSQDGELGIGHRYWGGTFYGMRSDEVFLLRRYLRRWRRLDWFGLRSWLYKQGLHQAVHTKKPFTCQATPPEGSGGYSHWYCREKRRHDGKHRFNNYTWGGDSGSRVVHSCYGVSIPDTPATDPAEN